MDRDTTPIQVHPTHYRRVPDETRKVSWLALFFDLIFVAIIVQLGTVLSHEVSWRGILEYVALFFPVWWAWNGLTFYMNRFVVYDLWHRILVFLQMFALGTMALVVTEAIGASAAVFAGAFVVVRVALMVQNIRAWWMVDDQETRSSVRHFLIGFSGGTLLWAISVAVPSPYIYGLWILASLLDLLIPMTFGRPWLRAVTPGDMPHLAERFGQLTLIALGETFLKVTLNLAGDPVTMTSIGLSALIFLLIASIWWLYFDDIAGTVIREGLPHCRSLLFWMYAHLFLLMGIVAIGVSSEKAIAVAHEGSLTGAERWLFGGALLLVLGSVIVLERVTRYHVSVTSNNVRQTAQWIAIVSILLLGWFGATLPVGIWLSFITGIAISQVGIDLWTGRPNETETVPQTKSSTLQKELS